MFPDSYVLLIDDDVAHARAFEQALLTSGDGPRRLEWRRTLASGFEKVAHSPAWAVFVNLSLPDSEGLSTLDELLTVSSDSPVLVIAGAAEEELGKQALLRGAQDFLLEGHVDSYAFSRAIRNVTEREAARQDLFLEQERARVTLDSIGDAVMSVDVAGRVTYMNAIAEQLTGWPGHEAQGRPFTEVFHLIDGRTGQRGRNPLLMAIEENRTVGLSANCILVRRDGHESAIEDSAAPIHDRNGQTTGAVIVFHDASMARSMVVEMSRMAQHDALTGLPNRLLLKERLDQAILLARRNHGHLAVLFLDVDDFKRINDTLGHEAGDLLIQAFGRRLSGCVRKSDTVCRLGGDEFVILLTSIAHSQDAALTAQKIIEDVRKPYAIRDAQLRVTVSVGISMYPESGADADQLIKNADLAMYRAKDGGRDGYQVFVAEMNLRDIERQSTEGELREALEDGRQLVLHYQPKIDLKTGVITGVEALVRWQHPSRGLLLPGHFLKIAEDSGLIVPLGRWVLQEACRQTRAWMDEGLPAVPVAINVSSLEFQNDGFIGGVRHALAGASLDPAYLELELTETVLMRHGESAARALENIRAMGVRLAIDDFGTGYSSLSYLTTFPIDALKLDQSFLRNVMTSPDDAVVVSAVITMARNLKHTVIAEGVETPEQFAFLQTEGCNEGQGYYFSRPVVANRLERLLETGIAAVGL